MTTFAPEAARARPARDEQVIRLAAAGVSLILEVPAVGLPRVLHWGVDAGALSSEELRSISENTRRGVSSSALDEPWPLTVLPTEADGWAGRPGMVLTTRDGELVVPDWLSTSTQVDERAVQVLVDAGQFVFEYALRIDEAGVLHLTQRLRNTAAETITVHALEATMPVGGRAREVLDFSGRWTRERLPQRRELTQGSFLRESRRGRSGHDSPFLSAIGTPGFSDRQGEVWATHLAWSADSVHRRDALPEAQTVIGVGELLRPGEIVLATGERYDAPEALFAWSDDGLDGLSRRFHRSIRGREAHPSTPRPVILNTWEAVYFDHDQPKLLELADVASSIGVERFVLDDGWFHGRRNDTVGLGDWFVDREVWPDGLHPLVDRVREHGMQFGIWVEPEMVSLDSDLAREHPDWVLGPVTRTPREWRHQQVLNLAVPEAWATVYDRLAALIDEYAIDYLKWDQNRDLYEAVPGRRAGVHAHTLALYRLLDALRTAYPHLEIESCASGGARVDLGILARTDRVWASDSNDPLERLAIQRWTELLLPPELIGSHVGPERAHTTKRRTDLGFRIAATLFASPGLELDLTACSTDDRVALQRWIGFYTANRSLLHGGDLHHGETGDAGTELTGVVDETRQHAIYRYARTATSEFSSPPRLLLPGLDGATRYHVRVVDALPQPALRDVSPPLWLERGETTGSGDTLGRIGLAAPLLDPMQALVLEVTAVG